MTMTTQSHVAEPMTAQDAEVVAVARLVQTIRNRFRGCMAISEMVGSADASEFGGRWLIDAYFIPSAQLLEFENYAAGIAAELEIAGTSVVVVSHTEEATEQHYAAMLKEKYPLAFWGRLGSAIVPDYIALPFSAGWPDMSTVAGAQAPWPQEGQCADTGMRAAA